MGRISRSGRIVTYSKVGLMVLSEHFEQRKIEATFSSFRSMIPLSTPSGPQHVESELEAELLEQLAFAPGVYDLLTQPIIHYTLDGKPRRYTPDIAVQLHASGDDAPCRYLIEVKRRADLLANASQYALKFQVGRLAAEATGAAFRIMDDARTIALNALDQFVYAVLPQHRPSPFDARRCVTRIEWIRNINPTQEKFLGLFSPLKLDRQPSCTSSRCHDY